MAERLGISYRTYHGYENGASEPKVKVIQSLMDMGFVAHWLMTGDGPMMVGSGDIGRADGKRGGFVQKQDPLDESLSARISRTISNVYREENARLSDDDRGRLLARIYNAVAKIDDPEDRLLAIGEEAGKLRADLRRTTDNQDKRLA